MRALVSDVGLTNTLLPGGLRTDHAWKKEVSRLHGYRASQRQWCHSGAVVACMQPMHMRTDQYHVVCTANCISASLSGNPCLCVI